MKKLYAFAAAALTALAMNAQSIYFMGDGTGLSWTTFPGLKVDLGDDGYYTHTFTELNQFKISTASATGWDSGFNANAKTISGSFTKAGVYASGGQTLTLTSGDADIYTPYSGTYTVKINQALTQITLSTTTTPPADGVATDAYIVGGMNSWGINSSWKMNVTNDGTNFVYTLDCAISSGVEFKFAQANTSNSVNWSGDINYGTGTTIAATQLNGTEINIPYNGNNMKLGEDFTGTVTLKIPMSPTRQAGKVSFTPKEVEVTYPDQLYLIGNINGHGFAPNDGIKLTQGEKGVYSAENVVITDADGTAYGYFSFCEQLSSSASDWNSLGTRYYAASKDQDVTLGTPMTGLQTATDQAYKILTGTYDVTVSLVDKTVLVTEATPAPDPTVTLATNGVTRQEDNMVMQQFTVTVTDMDGLDASDVLVYYYDSAKGADTAGSVESTGGADGTYYVTVTFSTAGFEAGTYNYEAYAQVRNVKSDNVNFSFTIEEPVETSVEITDVTIRSNGTSDSFNVDVDYTAQGDYDKLICYMSIDGQESWVTFSEYPIANEYFTSTVYLGQYNLTPGTEYTFYFVIKAFNSDSEVIYATEGYPKTFTTPGTAPKTLESFEVETPTFDGNQATFAYTITPSATVSESAVYQISWRDASTQDNFEVISTTLPAEGTFSLTLVEGQSYNLEFQAYCSEATNRPTTTVEFTVPTTTPGSFDQVEAVASGNIYGSATINVLATVSNFADNTEFNVYYYEGDLTTEAPAEVESVEGTLYDNEVRASIVLNDLTEGTEYSYVVYVESVEDTPVVSEKTLVTWTMPEAPKYPEVTMAEIAEADITPTSDGATVVVNVETKNIDNAVVTIVYTQQVSDEAEVAAVADAISGTATVTDGTFTISGLEAETEYTFEVYAQVTDGPRTAPQTITFTTLAEGDESGDDFPATVYMMGYNNVWSPDNALECTSAVNGVYTWEDVEFTGNYFNFCTVVAPEGVTDWDTTVNTSDRYGAAAGDTPIAVNETQAVTLYTGDETGACKSWKVELGTYTVVLNLATMEITLTGESGINGIEADAASVRYFNLQGVEVTNPAPGFYIQVRGNQATKVFVK